MSKSSTVDEALSFAEAVLNLDPKKGFQVRHKFNYFASHRSKQAKNIDDTQVIYMKPGQARSIEFKDACKDSRAGIYPQHNSIGSFPENLFINPSSNLFKFQGLSTVLALEENDFIEGSAVLTQKKLSQIQNQFANLSSLCFEEMMCLSSESKQRDFKVWYKFVEDEIIVAYINPNLEIVQFFQSYKLNNKAEVIDVKHIVCETGMPLVINQSFIDEYGNTRNIAHVGITGSKKNSFYNSLERFDDGSLVWTSTDYKSSQAKTGSAVLYDDGHIELLEGSDSLMAEFSARNLGAEGVDAKTMSWIMSILGK